ncbi:MAG: hypothetical protein QOI47_208 [Actinomycetota bacterium]|jgi:hypothetical protein|nr:hypothetical protein [Actinomycetota bacterium]
MSALAVMPMPRSAGSVAPYARMRASWLGDVAPVSLGFGLGSGSSCTFVTPATHQNQATEINAKAHAHRRSLEIPT